MHVSVCWCVSVWQNKETVVFTDITCGCDMLKECVTVFVYVCDVILG